LIHPKRHTFSEALRVAEAQAIRLRELLGLRHAAFPEHAIAGLPRLRIERRAMPTSGMSYWDGQQWVIALHAEEPVTRQRFTLLHEYKHIIDHGRTTHLYSGTSSSDGQQQAEQAANFFAGCALMPRTLVHRAWAAGRRTPKQLADLFQVSLRAAEVRLAQLGLNPLDNCHPRHQDPAPKAPYFRSRPAQFIEWSSA